MFSEGTPKISAVDEDIAVTQSYTYICFSLCIGLSWMEGLVSLGRIPVQWEMFLPPALGVWVGGSYGLTQPFFLQGQCCHQ